MIRPTTAQQLHVNVRLRRATRGWLLGRWGSNRRPQPRLTPRPYRPAFPHPALHHDRIERSIAPWCPLRAASGAPNRAFCQRGLGTNPKSLTWLLRSSTDGLDCRMHGCMAQAQHRTARSHTRSIHAHLHRSIDLQRQEWRSASPRSWRAAPTAPPPPLPLPPRGAAGWPAARSSMTGCVVACPSVAWWIENTGCCRQTWRDCGSNTAILDLAGPQRPIDLS